MWDGRIPVHPIAGVNLLYVEVPKAGCTSVKLALAPFRGSPPDDTDHEALHRWFGYSYAKHVGELQHWLATCWSEFFCFTVVRHPIARFESFYYEKLTDPERAVYGSIDRYVRDHFRNDEWRWNPHTVPQTALIGTDLSVFDHVGRVEDMGSLGKELSRRTQRRIVVPHANRSYAPRRSMSDETERELRDLFHADFEVLGYE